jgi:NodT family efflux transporter outer membrane factor (OMF) lipoprotein
MFQRNFAVLPAGFRLAFAAVVAAGVAGCTAVGPDFRRPDPQSVPAERPYTPEPMPAQTTGAPGAGGAVQRFAYDQDIPAQWWRLFHSEALNDLIRTALANSPTLVAAEAVLRQAQENYNAEYGSKALPSVSGQLGVTRERSIQFGPTPSIFTLYNANVAVSYTPDVFGGVRRDLEAFAATIEYQRLQLEAAHLALTANLVTTAIQEASLRAQLKAIREVVAAQEKSLELTRKQAELGAIARSPVLTLGAQVAQSRALLPALEKALAQTRHQLAVYAGWLPSQVKLPEFDLESLQLPVVLPVSLPSELVRQRPDIRASEALLHQASAQIGVATANLYPQITLSGNAGPVATRFADLFSGTGFLWSIGAGLVQPIFNGGALQARKRGAEAAYEAAAAQYQTTVLGAFQNVANTLRALELDAETLRAQAESESLSRQSLDLVSRQFKIGATSYLNLLDAQRTYQQSRVALAQAQAARFADTAALFQALGGGWWNRQPIGEPSRVEARPVATKE